MFEVQWVTMCQVDPFQTQWYYKMQQGVSFQTSPNSFLLCWSDDFIKYKKENL